MKFFEIFFTIISLLGTVSSILTAYLGAYAIILYIRHKNTARSQYTLELIDKLRLNDAASFPFEPSTKEFMKLAKAGEASSRQKDCPLFGHLADLEALGMAVRKGIVDEDMLYDYIGATVIYAFNSTKSMIASLRSANNNNHTILSDFEVLSRRWIERSQRNVG